MFMKTFLQHMHSITTLGDSITCRQTDFLVVFIQLVPVHSSQEKSWIHPCTLIQKLQLRKCQFSCYETYSISTEVLFSLVPRISLLFVNTKEIITFKTDYSDIRVFHDKQFYLIWYI